jgi:hypothetical protein
MFLLEWYFAAPYPGLDQRANRAAPLLAFAMGWTDLTGEPCGMTRDGGRRQPQAFYRRPALVTAALP